MSLKKQKRSPARELSSSKPRFIQTCVILFALSLVLRLLFLNANLDKEWPYSIFYYGDSGHYHEYAVSLIQGEQYDNGIPYHPPFYAWLLAGLYELLGIPTRSGYPFKVCMSILNSLTIMLSWIWFRKFLRPSWSLIATGILMFNFGWLVFSVTFNNEVLYTLFLVATIAIIFHAQRKMSWAAVFLLGLTMGFGSLTRAEHLSLWPFLLLYLWWQKNREQDPSHHWIRWSSAVVISLLVILPWSIHNYTTLTAFNEQNSRMETLPRIITVSAYGPVNFALANNHLSDGGFNPDLLNRITGGYSIDLNLQEHRYYFIHGYREGISWIRSNKREYLVLLSQKLSRWTDGLAIGFGVSDLPGGLRGSRAPADMFVPDRRILKWPFLILVMIGCVLSFRKNYRAYSVCTFLLFHRLIITLLFFGYARSMIVILPVVIPILLLPLTLLCEKTFPKLEKAIQYVAVIVAMILSLELCIAAMPPPQNYMSSGSVDERGKMIQDARVEIWPK